MSRLVILLACALAGCAADTEDLERTIRIPDGGPGPSQLECAFLLNNCCSDAVQEVPCTANSCNCPQGTIPVNSCPICQPDAATEPQRIACVQDFGTCCGSAVQLFECTSFRCECPPGYTGASCMNQCRADAG